MGAGRFARVLLAACLAGAGCAERTDDRSASGPPAGPPPTEPAVAVPARAPTVRTIDERDLAAALNARRGKVVLVDYWATWCEACVKLLPHTAALQRDLGPQGLAVLTVSLDDPEDEPKAVRALAAKGAVETENFLSRFGGSAESFARFNIPGTLPQLRLYDRAGKLRHAFSAEKKAVDPSEIDRAVARLLAEPAP